MGKEEVIKVVEDAIASLKDGSWTFPGITIAFLMALLYLIDRQ